MDNVVWDIESDGLIADVTKIHCMSFYNIERDRYKTFDTQRGNIEDGIKFLVMLLDKGDRIIGHNVSYDAVAVWKLHRELFDIFKYVDRFHDTLLHSKMIYPKFKLYNIKFEHETSSNKSMYSLGSWGERLGCPKDDYDGGWEEFSDEMLEYNKQDTKTNSILFKHLQKKRKIPKHVMNLDFYASVIATIQTMNGWVVDTEKITELEMKYEVLLRQTDIKLDKSFIPYYKQVKVVDTVRNASMWIEYNINTARSVLEKLVCRLKHYKNGKVKGLKVEDTKCECMKFYRKINISYVGPRTEIELVKFKAGSRQSIISFMEIKYGWKPSDRSDTGAFKLDMDTFKELEFTEAPLLAERFKITKKLSEVKTLLNYVVDGKIHHSLDILGASSTNRASASGPNLQQVSSDREFRELFIVPNGYKFVGTDLASIELMLLAIAIKPFDNGRMLDIMKNGNKENGTDLHSINARNMGVNRKYAKMVLYSVLYSSGMTLIGYNTWNGEDGKDTITADEFDTVYKSLYRRCEVIDGIHYFRVKKGLHVELTDNLVYMTIYGKSIKEKLIGGIVGFQDLIDSIVLESKDFGGYIESLDGRKLAEQSQHSLLNYKLQGNGAVFFKKWVQLFYSKVFGELNYPTDFMPYAQVHDEMVIAVRDDKYTLDFVRNALNEAVVEASNHFELPIEIECDTFIGNDWTEH